LEIFVHSDACMTFSCAICIKTDCKVRQETFVKKIQWSKNNISANVKHSEKTA